MSDLNICTFTGRLGTDPETRTTNAGDIWTTFRLAVSETWKDKGSGERKGRTEWITVVIWNQSIAKVSGDYLHKGDRCAVSGQWQTRKWQDKNGDDRYSTELVLPRFGGTLTLLGGREGGGAGSREERPATASRSGNGGRGRRDDERPNERGGYTDLDDEIPFGPEWRA